MLVVNGKNALEQTCDLSTHFTYSVTPRPATGLIQPAGACRKPGRPLMTSRQRLAYRLVV